MTSSKSLISWLESHIEHSNAYRVVDTYRVSTQGVELEVRILLQSDVPEEYAYIVEVENLQSGETSQHGNGGNSPEEALDLFHWHSILPTGKER